MPAENAKLVQIANDIRRAVQSGPGNEKESGASTYNVAEINELEKFIFYNTIFPDSHYSFVGFTGFDGRSVFPVVKQQLIKGGKPAQNNEIDCYMAAIGFEKLDLGKFQNREFLVWDILPKNVLKDESGDIFIIDIEIQYRGK